VYWLTEHMVTFNSSMSYPRSQCVLESQTSSNTGLALLHAKFLAQHDYILFLSAKGKKSNRDECFSLRRVSLKRLSQVISLRLGDYPLFLSIYPEQFACGFC